MSEQSADNMVADSGTIFPEVAGLKLLKEIARTPKGVVYKARRLVEHDIIAVKVFHSSVCERAFVEKLPENAERTFSLEHPGLVKSLGCIKEGVRLRLLMEYAAGDSLATCLRRGDPFSPAHALSITLQIANVLRYAKRRRVYHGRLHPADIIIHEDSVRVIGVGWGERPEHPAWDQKDPYTYEPLIYTAPESMPSKPAPENNALIPVDIYSLGGLLAHMLTGRPPYQSTDEVSLRSERSALAQPVDWGSDKKQYPADVMRLCERMLSEDPAQRPAYRELVNSLTSLLTDLEKAPKEGEPAAMHAAPARENAHHLIEKLAPKPQAHAHAHPHHRPPPREVLLIDNRDKVFAGLLACVAIPIAISAVVLAVKIFIIDPQNPTVIVKQEPANQFDPDLAAKQIQQFQQALKAAESQNPGAPAAPAAPPTPFGQALAARQFEKLEEMLKSGETKPTLEVVRLMRTIATQSGADTPIGLKATLRANEIEAELQPNKPVAVAPEKTAPQPEAKKETQVSTSPLAAVTPPPAAPPEDTTAAVNAVKSAMQRVKAFQYDAAKNEIDQYIAGAKGQSKRFAESYASILKEDMGLFARCRARLVEQIERHPRRESNLQVFPRKDDPNGDDIVDFDEKGLKIIAKSGPQKGPYVREWSKFPPIQQLNLIQLLVDRTSAIDQMGVAGFAFSRGLKEEVDSAMSAARTAGTDKEKVDALSAALTDVGNAAK